MEIHIYGSNECPYTRAALQLASAYASSYVMIPDVNYTKHTAIAGLEQKKSQLIEKKVTPSNDIWKQHTIPLIWMGSSFVGGFQDLKKKLVGTLLF